MEELGYEVEEVFNFKEQKGYRWVMFRIIICALAVTLCMMEAADVFMGFVVALVTLLLGVILLFAMLAYMKETEAQYKIARKFSWICIGLVIGYVVFHYLLTHGFL